MTGKQRASAKVAGSRRYYSSVADIAKDENVSFKEARRLYSQRRKDGVRVNLSDTALVSLTRPTGKMRRTKSVVAEIDQPHRPTVVMYRGADGKRRAYFMNEGVPIPVVVIDADSKMEVARG